MGSASIEPPIVLAGAGRARWDALIGTRVWRDPQIPTLAAYCATFGRWAEAEAWLADPEHGPILTIRDDKGTIRSHGPAPQLLIAERASKELARLAKLIRL